jgi:hypothetical protein
MKQLIKGITYDTETATLLSSSSDLGTSRDLYRTRDGRFFLVRRSVLVDGKPLPSARSSIDLLPDLALSPDSDRFKRARKRVAYHDTIKAMTRRQALAYSIRNLLPRTFHKDLARFLK